MSTFIYTNYSPNNLIGDTLENINTSFNGILDLVHETTSISAANSIIDGCIPEVISSGNGSVGAGKFVTYSGRVYTKVLADSFPFLTDPNSITYVYFDESGEIQTNPLKLSNVTLIAKVTIDSAGQASLEDLRTISGYKQIELRAKSYVDTELDALEATLSAYTDFEIENLTNYVDAKVSSRSFAQLAVIGDLAAHATSGGFQDFYLNPGTARTLKKIALTCPASAASGSIIVDVKIITSQGGSAVSLFPTKTKPTITCANGVAWATLSDAALDTVAIPDDSVIVVSIVSAPAECYDLRVELFE